MIDIIMLDVPNPPFSVRPLRDEETRTTILR